MAQASSGKGAPLCPAGCHPVAGIRRVLHPDPAHHPGAHGHGRPDGQQGQGVSGCSPADGCCNGRAGPRDDKGRMLWQALPCELGDLGALLALLLTSRRPRDGLIHPFSNGALHCIFSVVPLGSDICNPELVTAVPPIWGAESSVNDSHVPWCRQPEGPAAEHKEALLGDLP